MSVTNQVTARHYCRNPRCRTKLAEPVENPAKAFCCRGCSESFYLRRCLVCEKNISHDPMTGEARTGGGRKRQFCGRKCKAKARQSPHLYRWELPPYRESAKLVRSADKTGLKIGLKGDRPKVLWSDAEGQGWQWESEEFEHRLIGRDGKLAAHLWAVGSRWYLLRPRTSPLQSAASLDEAKRLAVSLALANLPLDPIMAARIERASASPAPSLPVCKRAATFDFRIAESKMPSDPGRSRHSCAAAFFPKSSDEI
jgi:hypothetical protein